MLERNDLWSTEVEKYLHRVDDSCESCSRTYEPKKARKASLSSLNRSFNELVCIDHFHLGNLRLCHIMCGSTRYPTASVVPNTGVEAAINVLDSHWISQFWAPKAIQFDQVFANELFQNFLTAMALKLDQFRLAGIIRMFWIQSTKLFVTSFSD